MFSKQNQTHPADARDAVKKQLLRSLMQQVVDEVSTMESNEFDSLVSSLVGDVDTSALRSKVEQQIHAVYSSAVDQSDIETTLAEKQAEMEATIEATISAERKQLEIMFAERIANYEKEAASAITSDIKTKLDSSTAELRKSLELDVTSKLDEIKGAVSETVMSQSRNDIENLKTELLTSASTGVQERVAQVQSDVEQQLKSQVDTEFDNLRSSVQKAVDSEIQKQQDAVDLSEHIEAQRDSIKTAISERVDGQINEMMQTVLEGQLDSLDFSSVTQSLAAESERIIRERFEDVSLNEIVENEKARVWVEVQTAIREVAKSTSANIQEEYKAQFTGELDASSKKAVEATIKKLTAQLSHSIRKNTTVTKEVVSGVVAQITEDESWNQSVSDNVSNTLVRHAAENVRNATLNSPSFVDHIYSDVAAETERFETIASSVRQLVIEEVARQSISKLGSAESLANEARDHKTFDDTNLTKAVALLRENFLRETALQATLSLSDTEALSKEAKNWINEEDSYIQSAVAAVVRTTEEVIATLARLQLNNSQVVAHRIAPGFTSELPEMKRAIVATTDVLVSKIAELTVESLTDAEEVAKRSATHISDDHEAIQKAVKMALSLVVDEVKSLTETRLYCTERIATDARGRMSKEIPEVIQAADVLENMLLSEVTSETTQRLYEIDKISEKAQSLISAEKELSHIQETVLKNILGTIAQAVQQELGNSEMISSRALKHVDLRHQHIIHATSSLKSRLLSEIAQGSLEQLAQTDTAVLESRQRIDAQSPVISKVSDTLYRMLIDQLANVAVSRLSNTSETVSHVLDRVQGKKEVMNEVQELVHDQMVERLVSHSLTEIKEKVFTRLQDAQNAFFQSTDSRLKSGVQHDKSAPPVETPVQEFSAVEPPISAPLESAEQRESGEQVEPADQGESAEQIVSPEQGESPEQVDWTPLFDMDDENAEFEGPTESSGDTKTNASFSTDAPDPLIVTPSKSWSVSEFTLDESEVASSEDVTESASNGQSDSSARAFDQITGSNEPTYYLYGIVSTEDATKAAFTGIEGLQPGSTVTCLNCGDLTAIISNFTDPAYSPYFIRNSMRDTEWLKGQVRHHAGVLSEAKGLMTIIPLRFGTVFNAPNGIRRFVENQRGKLQNTLSRLQNKSEFGIRVLGEVNQLEHAMKVKGLTADELNTAICNRIHGPLTDLSSEAVQNALLPQSELSETRVVLNATYLVPVVGEKNFRARITDLAKELLTGGIRIEVSGPWPPYHFVDIDINGAEEVMGLEIPV